MVRADFVDVFRVLDGRAFGRPVSIRPCRTPSSVHTLARGLETIPEGPVFCTMVDTVMPPGDWRAADPSPPVGPPGRGGGGVFLTPFRDCEGSRLGPLAPG